MATTHTTPTTIIGTMVESSPFSSASSPRLFADLLFVGGAVGDMFDGCVFAVVVVTGGGASVGAAVGGTGVGSGVGSNVTPGGSGVGSFVGGTGVGDDVGAGVGEDVGEDVGFGVGGPVGLGVGGTG